MNILTVYIKIYQRTKKGHGNWHEGQKMCKRLITDNMQYMHKSNFPVTFYLKIYLAVIKLNLLLVTFSACLSCKLTWVINIPYIFDLLHAHLVSNNLYCSNPPCSFWFSYNSVTKLFKLKTQFSEYYVRFLMRSNNLNIWKDLVTFPKVVRFPSPDSL